MSTNLHESFLQLVRLGIEHTESTCITDTLPRKTNEWKALWDLADRHGLSAVVLDALNTDGANLTDGMPLEMKLEWIGDVLQNYEQRYEQYKKAIESLAGFYNQHGFKMMVLKGYACSLDWPKPEHRPCGDIDIWLFSQQEAADKELVSSFKFQDPSFEIDGGQHHHTVFEWDGFTVENHYDFINVHHHPSHRGLEAIFKELGKDDSHYVEVSGERVYVPSPNLHALFLLRHALNHFPSIGINLRNVLDWAFFIEMHTKEIDWKWLEAVIEEYHMRDFYNCINAICVENLGFNAGMFPSVQYLPSLKEMVLNDILDPEFTIDEPDGLFRKWIHKYRRWRGNRWKQELCYRESAWSVFWSGVMIHLVKPKAIKDEHELLG